MAGAMRVRAEPDLDPLKKDPGVPRVWVGLKRVRSDALASDFVSGGWFMEEFLVASLSSCLTMVVIGCF